MSITVILAQGPLREPLHNVYPFGKVEKGSDYFSAAEAKGQKSCLTPFPKGNLGTMWPAATIAYFATIGNVANGWQVNPQIWHLATQRRGAYD